MELPAAEGTTMVVVTHEMDFAREVADRVVFMENGVIIEETPSKEFFRSPEQESTKRFLFLCSKDHETAKKNPPAIQNNRRWRNEYGEI